MKRRYNETADKVNKGIFMGVYLDALPGPFPVGDQKHYYQCVLCGKYVKFIDVTCGHGGERMVCRQCKKTVFGGSHKRAIRFCVDTEGDIIEDYFLCPECKTNVLPKYKSPDDIFNNDVCPKCGRTIDWNKAVEVEE